METIIISDGSSSDTEDAAADDVMQTSPPIAPESMVSSEVQQVSAGGIENAQGRI
jgi:hypothetical protein